MRSAVLTFRETAPGGAQFWERDVTVRAEPSWLGLRLTSHRAGRPPLTQAAILTLDQADRLEDFLRTNREARELAGQGDQP